MGPGELGSQGFQVSMGIIQGYVPCARHEAETRLCRIALLLSPFCGREAEVDRG
jgi:hypothetical protein